MTDLSFSHRAGPPAPHPVRLRHARIRAALDRGRRASTRILVVADAFNAARVDLLGLTGTVTVFGEVKPEPTPPIWRPCCARAVEAQAEVVIGFGGGSAMDLAKLAAVLPAAGRPFRMWCGTGKGAPASAPPSSRCPPRQERAARAGTRALVTDPATQNKLAVQSLHMLADLAVVDPDLTLSVPPAVTAATAWTPSPIAWRRSPAARRTPPSISMRWKARGSWGRYPESRHRRWLGCGSPRRAGAGLALWRLLPWPGEHHRRPCGGLSAGHAPPHRPRSGQRAHLPPTRWPSTRPPCRKRPPSCWPPSAFPPRPSQPAVLKAAHGWCAGTAARCASPPTRCRSDDLPVMATEAHAIRRLLDNNPRDMSREDILAIYRAAYIERPPSPKSQTKASRT